MYDDDDDEHFPVLERLILLKIQNYQRKQKKKN